MGFYEQAASQPDNSMGRPPQRVLNVVLVCLHGVGGTAHYVSQLANALVEEGHQVAVIAPVILRSEYFRPEVEIIRLAALSGATKRRNAIDSLRLGGALAAVRIVRQREPDVVHYVFPHPWNALLSGFLGDVPSVYTCHDPRFHLGETLVFRTVMGISQRCAMKRAGAVVTHGESLKRVLMDQGYEHSKIHVVPHGEYSFFTRFRTSDSDPEGSPLSSLSAKDPASGNILPAAPAAPGSKEVLFFGRIERYKGLEYLIEASPAIARKVPGFRLVIAGMGDFRAYSPLVKEPSLFEIINRFMSDEEVAELFYRASIVALPYVEATQSGVIPIAYGFGKPVVATTVGAIPEIVEHGRTGLLVPPRDSRALAEAIVELLLDDDLRRRIGEAGRRKGRDELGWRQVAQKTVVAYRQAMVGRGGRGGVRGPKWPGG